MTPLCGEQLEQRSPGWRDELLARPAGSVAATKADLLTRPAGSVAATKADLLTLDGIEALPVEQIAYKVRCAHWVIRDVMRRAHAELWALEDAGDTAAARRVSADARQWEAAHREHLDAADRILAERLEAASPSERAEALNTLRGHTVAVPQPIFDTLRASGFSAIWHETSAVTTATATRPLARSRGAGRPGARRIRRASSSSSDSDGPGLADPPLGGLTSRGVSS